MVAIEGRVQDDWATACWKRTASRAKASMRGETGLA
jgi:hypothetical protein